MPAIANRCGHVCIHSGPSAPERNFCSQIVQTLAAAERRKKGASTTRSCRRTWPLSHQRQSASTTGSITVEGLLVIAIAKKTNDKLKRHRLCSGWLSALSAFRKNRIDNK